jgi:hypothetical protein
VECAGAKQLRVERAKPNWQAGVEGGVAVLGSLARFYSSSSKTGGLGPLLALLVPRVAPSQVPSRLSPSHFLFQILPFHLLRTTFVLTYSAFAAAFPVPHLSTGCASRLPSLSLS